MERWSQRLGVCICSDVAFAYVNDCIDCQPPCRHHTLSGVVDKFLSLWSQYLCYALGDSQLPRTTMMAAISLFSIHNAAGGRGLWEGHEPFVLIRMYCTHYIDDKKGCGRVHLMGVALQFLVTMTTSAILCCLAILRRRELPPLQVHDMPKLATPPGDTSYSENGKYVSDNEHTPSALPLAGAEGVSSEDMLTKLLPSPAQSTLLGITSHLALVRTTISWFKVQDQVWSACAQEVDGDIW